LLEYRLCQIYHCTPSQLQAESAAVIWRHIEVLGGINIARKLKGKNGKK